MFDAGERAILRFTDLLTTRPGNVEGGDLDALAAHFNEEQIVELVLTVTAANMTNRLNEGLRTPAE